MTQGTDGASWDRSDVDDPMCETQPPHPVSVILPLHNVGHESLPGVVRTITDLATVSAQVLVIDDGSDDGTGVEIAAALRGIARVQLLQLEKNRGVAHARNTALGKARERYVWFLDWDDRWSPDMLSTMVKRAEEESADAVICRAVRVDSSTKRRVLIDGIPDDTVLDGVTVLRLILMGQVQGYLWSKLLRRDLLPVPMFPIQRSQSDFAGLVPVLARATRVATVSEVLYEHLVRSGSITNSADPDLDLLYRSRDVVRSVVMNQPVGVSPALVQRYDYEHVFVARAVTAARLFRDRAAAADVARASADQITWRGVASVFIVDRRVSARAALLKVARGRYPSLYSAQRHLHRIKVSALSLRT